MKVLVLLSLVALCFAQSTYSHNYISVSSNGVINIHGSNGKEIVIYQNQVNPTKVNVILNSIYGPAKKIVVDAANNINEVNLNTLDAQYLSIFQNLGSAYNQQDALIQVFHHYEGLVNAVQYQELLDTIHYLVQQGIVHPNIEHVLQYYYSQQQQQWVANNEQYVPHMGQNSVGSYGIGSPYVSGLNHNAQQYLYNPEYNQNMTPLQHLHYLIQHQHYGQGYQNGQQSYQQNYPEYQTVYNKYSYPYEQHQGYPVSNIWSGDESQTMIHPYQWQYQTPNVHQQAYHQGSHNQYPQGLNQKQSWVPQQWWNGQQLWSGQQWIPLQNSASQQYTPQHHVGLQGVLPLVH